MIQVNLFKKQTHRLRKQTWLPKQKGGREKWGIVYLGLTETYYYIHKINNKNLLYSTENYIQYLVITYNEKESEK